MRLTPSEKVFKENGLETGSVFATQKIINKAFHKLSQLEDIEDELGIDLLTLFKALKQGYIIDVFFNEEVRSMDVSGEQSLLVDFSNKCFYDCFISKAGKYDKCYYFEDYGKTWALTKEELL